MSSARKDARWQLATEMANLVEVDFVDTITDPATHGTGERILVAADVLLSLNPEMVDELAEKWNEKEE